MGNSESVVFSYNEKRLIKNDAKNEYFWVSMKDNKEIIRLPVTLSEHIQYGEPLYDINVPILVVLPESLGSSGSSGSSGSLRSSGSSETVVIKIDEKYTFEHSLRMSVDDSILHHQVSSKYALYAENCLRNGWIPFTYTLYTINYSLNGTSVTKKFQVFTLSSNYIT